MICLRGGQTNQNHKKKKKTFHSSNEKKNFISSHLISSHRRSRSHKAAGHPVVVPRLVGPSVESARPDDGVVGDRVGRDAVGPHLRQKLRRLPPSPRLLARLRARVETHTAVQQPAPVDDRYIMRFIKCGRCTTTRRKGTEEAQCHVKPHLTTAAGQVWDKIDIIRLYIPHPWTTNFHIKTLNTGTAVHGNQIFHTEEGAIVS